MDPSSHKQKTGYSRSDQIVETNALLRELLGEVQVWGDADAPDGMAIEIRGEASRIFRPRGGTAKSARGGAFVSGLQISLVAGIRNQRTSLVADYDIPHRQRA